MRAVWPYMALCGLFWTRGFSLGMSVVQDGSKMDVQRVRRVAPNIDFQLTNAQRVLTNPRGDCHTRISAGL